jgi:hypothetical protein
VGTLAHLTPASPTVLAVSIVFPPPRPTTTFALSRSSTPLSRAEPPHRTQHVDLAVAQVALARADGRLHRHQAQELQQMVLHHVLECADAVVVPPPAPPARPSRPTRPRPPRRGRCSRPARAGGWRAWCPGCSAPWPWPESDPPGTRRLRAESRRGAGSAPWPPAGSRRTVSRAPPCFRAAGPHHAGRRPRPGRASGGGPARPPADRCRRGYGRPHRRR